MPRRDVKFILGDWNAKVGSDNTGWEHVMGPHGIGDRNDPVSYTHLTLPTILRV